MKILVLYHLSSLKIRNTLKDHLFSFRKFSNEHCFYLNTAYGVPKYIVDFHFDIIIYHYTITAQKTLGEKKFRNYLASLSLLKKIKGFKTVLPQDEYHYTLEICKFYKEFNIDMVFNVFSENSQKDWRRLFPLSNSGVQHYKSVLTGYASEPPTKMDDELFLPLKKNIDVGYRARKLPYSLGRLGYYKWKMSDVFLEKNKQIGLKMDVSNDSQNVIIGKNWNEFLKSCRTILGTESGASIHDLDGEIEKNIMAYLIKNHNATYEEVESKFLMDEAIHINLAVISPRVFEAIEAGACLVMMEGDYNGIIKENIHYIPVKKDFSNINEILKKIEDKGYCQKMAQKTYEEIIMSGLYSYSSFVKSFISEVLIVCKKIGAEKTELTKKEKKIYYKLIKREKNPFIFNPLKYIKVFLKNLGISFFGKLGLKNSKFYLILKRTFE
jgi:hypothetical protein